ncbi:MAG: DUF1553 domain-containing protein [Pirellulaceae bacterium]
MVRFVPLLLTLSVALLASTAAAEEALHDRIDQLIEAKLGETQTLAQAAAGDAQFVRRVYLDLAGRIPTVAETRAFLDDKADDKRAGLIDRLLAGDDYPRRMQELFHVMLMERRGDNEEWTKFLRASFEQNRPWDEIARAIIRPEADDETKRGAAYFFTARLVSEGAMAPVDVPGLTTDFGRLLAGVDLSCAQCHDHISIDDYKQLDFQGLHMIFENVKPRRDVPFPAVSEEVLTAKKEFMSVFTQVPMETAPRVPGGEEMEILTFPKGEEYAVEPDRKTKKPGVPKFSPLAELSQELAASDNDLFCKNIANRLWFVMMGRGLVEPLDLRHSANPPSHPELLELLADEFAAHKFDMKWLLKEIALTSAYQRTSVLGEGQAAPPRESYAVANEKRISAEQLFWSTMLATGEFDRQRKEQQDGQKKTLEQLVADAPELAKLRDEFLKVFANPPKEPEVEFEPTVAAALFLMHDESVLNLLKPNEGNLIDRLTKLDSDEAVADAMFLAILSRTATDDDRQDVAEYLKQNEDRRSEAIGEVAWALLASTEFIVNH